MGGINGKTIWVTGASSGIGEALVYALNLRGCNLIISSRHDKDLQEVKKKCRFPEKVGVLELDLAYFEEFPSKVDTAITFFGKLDILINNAGVSQRSLIADTDMAVYKKLVDINYLGTVALTKALLPYFLAQGHGHFVAVTSLMGKFGSPYRSGYCGAKHALHGFFDVLRMEHGNDGIEVTLVCPGFVRTHVAKNALTSDGSPQVTDDEATKNGIPVDVFARKMIRAIEKSKYEAYIGRNEIMGVYVKRFFPKLLHKMVLKSTVR